jgi:hypothetical protein
MKPRTRHSFTVRLDQELFEALVFVAKAQHRTIQASIAHAIERDIERFLEEHPRLERYLSPELLRQIPARIRSAAAHNHAPVAPSWPDRPRQPRKSPGRRPAR